MNRDMAAQIELRMMIDADVPYVAKTWVESYRRESQWSRGMTDGIYYPAHRHLINQVIKRAPTIVAANPENPSHVVGFCCGERRSDVLTVHFLAVKYTFRNFGIARALLNAFQFDGREPIIATHWTHACVNAQRRARPVIFNPYILFTEYRSFWNDPAAEAAEPRREIEDGKASWNEAEDTAVGERLSPGDARPRTQRTD